MLSISRAALSRAFRRTSPAALRPGLIACSNKRGFSEVSNFPGASSPYTQELNFVSGFETFPCYRVMNQAGDILAEDHDPQLDQETLTKMYKDMNRLNSMDQVLYDAQRQGRISFYMTSFGEEATHIGSAAALSMDDVIYGQYRESGVLMYRGYTIDDFVNQCFSNKHDPGRGRQMPIHYSAPDLNFQTISSPLATQIPQASGAAYALKRAGKDAIAVCYFGDGAASEGDFHAALNFAATLDCPVLFFCRNNGYAISTPTAEQYRGDGIAARGPAYGIPTIRVDGNDLFAVYNATTKARKMAVEESRPVLIEAMTYRVGHHSTSDDATRYRNKEETEHWKLDENPVTRIRLYMEQKGWWDADQEAKLVNETRESVLNALSKAEVEPKPAIKHLFSEVYSTKPDHLVAQEKEMMAHIAKYPADYPTDGYDNSE